MFKTEKITKTLIQVEDWREQKNYTTKSRLVCWSSFTRRRRDNYNTLLLLELFVSSKRIPRSNFCSFIFFVLNTHVKMNATSVLFAISLIHIIRSILFSRLFFKFLFRFDNVHPNTIFLHSTDFDYLYWTRRFCVLFLPSIWLHLFFVLYLISHAVIISIPPSFSFSKAKQTLFFFVCVWWKMDS